MRKTPEMLLIQHFVVSLEEIFKFSPYENLFRTSVMNQTLLTYRLSRQGRPEEAAPVGVLKDVGQDAGEETDGVQHHLLVLGCCTAALGCRDKFLYRLRKVINGCFVKMNTTLLNNKIPINI